jgi:hypothetical protein
MPIFNVLLFRVLFFRRVYISMSVVPKITRYLSAACDHLPFLSVLEKRLSMKLSTDLRQRMKSHMTSHHFLVTFVVR